MIALHRTNEVSRAWLRSRRRADHGHGHRQHDAGDAFGVSGPAASSRDGLWGSTKSYSEQRFRIDAKFAQLDNTLTFQQSSTKYSCPRARLGFYFR